MAENVALPLRLGHVAGGEEATARALARMGLSDLADRLPGELSGGQAQRAGIARAMAHAPKLLPADEPTGQLDRDTAQLVLAALLDHARALGSGLVIATHDAAIAQRLDRTWRMDHGRLSVARDDAPPRPLETVP